MSSGMQAAVPAILFDKWLFQLVNSEKPPDTNLVLLITYSGCGMLTSENDDTRAIFEE